MLARKELTRTPNAPPPVPPIDRIQQLLASTGSPGTFATRHTAGPDELDFDVVGVGAVPLPLSRRTADRLRAVAKPARYGLREKTLLGDPGDREVARARQGRCREATHRRDGSVLEPRRASRGGT
jgi:hypothetical protein